MLLTDQVAHLVLLGLEVELVGGLGGDDGREALDHLNAGQFQSFDLLRVVGHQANGGNAEHLEDLGGQLEVAAVGGVAEFKVGFDGVAALVLQLVGLELGHETDSAALLVLVEEDAGAVVGDGGEGELELLAAVAAQRVEDIAGEALRVDANDGRLGVEVAHDEGDGGLDADGGRGERVVAGLGIFDNTFKAEDAEVAPAGGEIGIGHLAEREERHSFDYTETAPGPGGGRLMG